MYKLTACYMVKYVCILKIFLLFDVASVRVVTQKRLWMLWGCPSLHLLVKLCGTRSVVVPLNWQTALVVPLFITRVFVQDQHCN